MINLKKVAAFCCLLFCSLQMFAAVSRQNQPGISLKEALKNASSRFHVSFIYEDELVANKTAALLPNASFKNVEAYLEVILKPYRLQFRKLGNTQYAVYSKAGEPASKDKSKTSQVEPGEAAKSQAAPGQPPARVIEVQISQGDGEQTNDRTIRGIVTDENDAPITSATVRVPGSNLMVLTNAQGEYAITVPLTTRSLQISCIAYETKDLQLSRTTWYDVKLKDKTGYLKPVEVVSTGYVNLPKERATGSFGVVTAKELEKIPTANVLQRLEGQVPGLQMQITSGDNSFVYDNVTPAIGSNTRTIGRNDYGVNIRGTTTIKSEQMPLIVIDGFPTEMDLKNMNPNDIEQITFLRDAAAASIWGSRAANGVIVITTKKGRMRMPAVNFSVGLSTQAKPSINYLPLINSTQVLAYEKELVDKGVINASMYNPYTAGIKYYVSEGVDLAYQLRAGRITQAQYDARAAQLGAMNNYGQVEDYLLQSATSQNYNLSVSGGSDVHTYFVSGSYSKENPSAVGSSGERITLTANQELKVIKKITLSLSLKGSFFNYKQNGRGASVLLGGMNTFMPYNTIVDANGNPSRYYHNIGQHYADSLTNLGYKDWSYNFFDELTQQNNTSTDNNYSGNLSLNIPIYKGLTFIGSYAIERVNFKNEFLYGVNSFYTRNLYNLGTVVENGRLVKNVPDGAIFNNNYSMQNNHSIRAQLAFNRGFGGIHELNALAGTETRETNASVSAFRLYGYNPETGVAQDVNYAGFYNTINGGGGFGQGPSQTDRRNRFLSYFANAAYTLMGRYTLSGSVRYDDYNNFGLDRKYRARPFWSAGASWNITREEFMKSQPWITNLTLRATYGVNGNINRELRPFTNISLGASDWQTTLPYASITAFANPALRWESTYVTNIGIDYSLFNGRLSGMFEVYDKQGRDIIYELEVNPTYLGNSNTQQRNGVSMSNRGIDMAINGAIIDSKNFGWNMGVNFSYNTSKVTDNRFLPTSSLFSSLSNTVLNGYPADGVWVFRNAGLSNTGLTQIYDEKGQKLLPYQNLSNVDALKFAGRRGAPYYGSFNNTVRYKSWSLFALITYNFGSIFLKPAVSDYPSTRRFYYNLSKDIADRWQQPGDEEKTIVPAVGSPYSGLSAFRYAFSDANLESGDYIRFREVSVAYQLPEAIVGKVFAKSIRVSGIVRNLGLLWTKNKLGIDPDFVPTMNSNIMRLPPTRNYSLMINIGL
ncbi:SusC/RagA family TonB-linked outer membrane protein [Chitinophaga rhizophila]|uniref:SusC/RagA family TonB-linked outer membrane protein n=1 Tax=Chitinophaga rhizophila TaxID=2866212 RepID=A0ABS7GAU4_9BACT|nr:SusC/RagA family TonB-linked outer membrane protein [Chitinophaga rhizophila]MBW8684788.1 SusC/RagA family TonB-linked outer membrane protein [Chitinophaga rhizophila]